ncbi:Phytoene/squalene synthetase [Meinhardsimonia xiamenensis]|jgi:phytoene/squalene synthetase|uniref:Phytoene/squalene synthetase n=1 Tax=Meinhardsimonia xiamenensis TaxID=990712 RepID=A0A1G9BFN4_9RHOB|nr:squalene/phytoene synthase family protein [Meinhardsimonia xiamenensis]PRX35007.1 phytoene/squalene synthetase [Meinhardsimonia xiamenensis]SDK37990.1 Phytoene/squalene synthetase [Meinhardsimonia xiamenensis]
MFEEALAACAENLRRGDPDRFLALMAAPPPARRVLLPLYAFNLEVARAPWVSAEPTIGAIRLEWWREALGEIAEGRPVRRHEVTLPLAEVLDAEGARLLDDLVVARWADLERAPFADVAALGRYLEATGGRLMQVAGRLLGAGEADAALAALGSASALANWCLAVPELRARGRAPLPPEGEEALAALAVERLAAFRAARKALPRAARPAALAAWRAPAILARVARDPAAVAEGRLAQSEFRRRGSLLLASLFGV